MAAPSPSDRARELVRGAFDLHIHVDPDVVGRSVDDVTLAEQCRERGLAGFGLKSHYTSTAERARVVNARRARGARGRRDHAQRAPSAGSTRWRSRSPRARARGSCGCRPSTRVNEASARDRRRRRARKSRCGRRSRRSCARWQRRRRSPVVDDDGEVLPELPAGARGRRAPRAGARDRAPRARRDLHGGRRGARARACATSSSPTRSSQPGPVDRRPAGAGRARRGARALLHHPPHRQVHLGARGSRASAPSARSAPCSRPTWASPPTRRSRTGCALFADQLLEAGFTDDEMRTMAVDNTVEGWPA